MAAVTTSDFVKAKASAEENPFTLIEPKGLIARLVEEIARAASELRSNPRRFLRNLIFSDTKDAKRRRLIYVCLACALAFHVALIIVIAIASWHYVKVNAKSSVTWLPKDTLTAKIPDGPELGALKGGGGGGGGGGKNDTRPASGGATPQMAPRPQIVHPLAPTMPDASLVVPPTVVGPESLPVPPNIQLGDPNGKMDAPPSPGSGSDGGMGGGKGTGVGDGGGPGAGPGNGGGPGGEGKTSGSPEGTVSPVKDEYDWRLFSSVPNKTPFAWIYKANAIVTPEAQANKIIGTVLLRATFRADGKITDIEIVNGVKYMTESAIESLERSKFRPATVNGKPVTLRKVLVRIEVHY